MKRKEVAHGMMVLVGLMVVHEMMEVFERVV